MSGKKTARAMLADRLDKTVSREMAAIVLAGYGMIETNAPPELLALFSGAVVLILQTAKIFDSWSRYRSKKGAVEAVEALPAVDTQDTPSDGPTFEV